MVSRCVNVRVVIRSVVVLWGRVSVCECVYVWGGGVVCVGECVYVCEYMFGSHTTPSLKRDGITGFRPTDKISK